MPSRPPSLRPASQLRADAEAELARAPPQTASTRSAEEDRHELQVNEIELQMQNENLLQAQLFFEQHSTRYRYLYELAPIGYLTLDHSGTINEINVSGLGMLGAEREHLLGHRLDDFIAFADREHWQRQFIRSRAHDTARTFDLRLAGRGSATVVHVNCVRAVVQGNDRPLLYLTLTDISERQRSEAILQESEERFRRVFEVANDAVFLVDSANGHILEANPAAEKLYGYSRAELLALNATDLSLEPEKTCRTLRTTTPFLQTSDHRKKDGSEFPVEISGSGFMKEGRQVWVGAVRDISDRRRAEEGQAHSHALNLAILNSVCAEIAVLDRAGTITAVNQSWRRFAVDNGLLPGQPAPKTDVGTHYLAFCVSPPGEGEGEDEANARAARTGIEDVLAGRRPCFSLEYPCHSPTQKRWFSMSVTPLDFDGQGAVVSHTNISDRKEIEQKLQESEERYRALVEWSPEGICVHRDGRVLYVNATAIRMFGAESARQLVGCPLLERVHPDCLELILGQIRKIIDGHGEVVVTEARYLRFDGTVVDIAVHSALIAYAGEMAIHCSMRDVTERNRTERELTSLRREMEEMMTWQVARHTATALAHEVNQPLASIAALCEGTRRLFASGGGDAPATRIRRIEDAIQRLGDESARAGAVVRDLLESLHAPDASKQSTPLCTIFKEVEYLMRAGRLSDCRLLVDCPPHLPPVWINLRQVEKALLNLIGNSVEAMHRIGMMRGRIWISAAMTDDGASVRVTVRDEGPGLGPDVEQQLFHPLMHRQPGNLGMGLAISRTLIQAQGGTFWHQAEEGRGAVFHFILPLTKSVDE